jgi:hypothetical protein
VERRRKVVDEGEKEKRDGEGWVGWKDS